MFPGEAGPVGHRRLSVESIFLAPGVVAPRALALAAPMGASPGAAAQPSVMLNNSRMRGVAKGCMSWMRSSRWVCSALMLRSSVSIAMIDQLGQFTKHSPLGISPHKALLEEMLTGLC